MVGREGESGRERGREWEVGRERAGGREGGSGRERGREWEAGRERAGGGMMKIYSQFINVQLTWWKVL